MHVHRNLNRRRIPRLFDCKLSCLLGFRGNILGEEDIKNEDAVEDEDAEEAEEVEEVEGKPITSYSYFCVDFATLFVGIGIISISL